MLRSRVVVATSVLVFAASGLTACGGEERWCEHDATDTVVADSYCENGTAGYEWESGSSSKHKKRKKTKSSKSSKRKTTRIQLHH